MDHPKTLLLATACFFFSLFQSMPAQQPVEDVEHHIPRPSSQASLPEGIVDYARDIRPVLSDTCFSCHGPDPESREAELRLDTLDGALGETSSGLTAVLPGDLDQSEVWQRISSTDQALVMPPIDSGKALTKHQIELIRLWIEQGAPWKEHWAFVKPIQSAPPSVSNSSWPKNIIDHFILAKLDELGWHSSPEADKETLIRRVSFDLTGLPPTIEEVKDFLADDSSTAYRRLVDRLLESPAYGEHMARYWLDAARYGDTHGMHFDNYREMWLYRDWVVRSFNENLPYDEFIVQQLAGDLLSNPTIDQQVATGFCRCHVTTNEGGSIEEEVYVRNVVDRVSTTGTALLGLSLGCAVCHDHKFDPVSQKDFYQLFAFFNSLDGPALDGNVKDPAPVVHVPEEDQAALLQGLHDEIQELQSQIDSQRKQVDAGYGDWLAERQRSQTASLAGSQLDMEEGLLLHANLDEDRERRIANQADPGMSGYTKGSPQSVEGIIGKGFKLVSHSYLDFGNVCDFQDDVPFSYGAWVKTKPNLNGAIIAKIDVSDFYKGYDLSVNDDILSARLTRRRSGYSIKVSTKPGSIKPDRWHHVFVTYDGSKLAKGLLIYVNGERQQLDILSDSLKHKGGIRNKKPLLVGRRDTETEFAGGSVDEVCVYDRRLSDTEVRALYLVGQLGKTIRGVNKIVSAEENKLLRELYLIWQDKAYLQLANRQAKLFDSLRIEESAIPTTLVFRERREPREAFVLNRGKYDQRGERVARRTPDWLPAMKDHLSKDRLGLAHWMTSDEHPLTSRVAVNRFWQQVFGTGLVETSDDFGSQGTPPSHPELLDWLAVEFRKSGWDVKSLMRTMVMSRTYRQSSQTSPILIQQDPKNKFLARGPRFRLDAEMLRDQALAVSGLLVRRLGGPSVKPPQPRGLWHAVGFTNSNTASFVSDTEPEKIYRRSLYTFHKRTSPPPSMSTFDAPSRESSCVRRERTNTPLQALVLLNDPQYFDAARALAERGMREIDGSNEARAAHLYRLATSRQANEESVAELVQLFEDQLAEYQIGDGAAEKTASVTPVKDNDGLNPSELAAWTIVSNLLLNLDEVVSKN